MYLVGTLEKWNNAKQSECKERYQHIDSSMNNHKYVSVDKLVRLGMIESKKVTELPDWWVNQFDQINNKSCACVNSYIA